MIARRAFLGTLACGLLALRSEDGAAEPGPETPTIRLFKFPGICLAPQYVAEELLRAEGFTDVRFVSHPPAESVQLLAEGKVEAVALMTSLRASAS
jgi:NitT/TauT family transport system substrate-binding protein